MESILEDRIASFRLALAAEENLDRKRDLLARQALLLLEDDLLSISRMLAEGVYLFAQAFPSLAASDQIRSVFGKSFVRRLQTGKVTVEIAARKTKYMRVSERDGRLIIDKDYLLRGDSRFLLLDLIHELVHVRQFVQGRDLYDDYLAYVDRPVELEAFALSLREARRLQMSDTVLRDYLKLEWITEGEYLRLLEHLGIVSEMTPTICRGAGRQMPLGDEKSDVRESPTHTSTSALMAVRHTATATGYQEARHDRHPASLRRGPDMKAEVCRSTGTWQEISSLSSAKSCNSSRAGPLP